jgi:hypothetical protein
MLVVTLFFGDVFRCIALDCHDYIPVKACGGEGLQWVALTPHAS